jgi:hypothetical protein
MGGPWGFKWVVLLLVHLYGTSRNVKDGKKPNYEGVHVTFNDADIEAIEQLCTRLIEKMRQSTATLLETEQERTEATNQPSDNEVDNDTLEQQCIYHRLTRRDQWMVRPT